MNPLPPVPQPADDSSGAADIFGLPSRDPANDAISRDPVERAATEFLDELRAGQHPSIDVFALRYSAHAKTIRQVLPMLAALEQWKTSREPGVGTTAQSTMAFERLGDCRIVREIGRGGMGVVFEAVQEPTGRRVAIKVLPWKLPASSHWRQRFVAEAQLTARLRHPHIVPVYGFGEQEGWCYYIMHLVEGLPLDKVIRLLKQPEGVVNAEDIRQLFLPGPEAPGTVLPGTPEGAPPVATPPANPSGRARVLRRDSWPQIAKIGMQAASALRYAHAQGTLHRDIKPGNLLLDRHGSVWIADFGIAHQKDALSGDDDRRTGGTLAYIAPEQLDGTGGDERSDIYSLGATLYELCTLQPAFAAATRTELLERVRTARPPRPRSINRRIPAELESIILKAMSRDRSARFQSADELLTALRQFLQGQGTAASSSTWLGGLGGIVPFRD